MMSQQQQQRQHYSLRTFSISDDAYFKLKELSSLKGKKHVAFLVREIFADYIRQHESELMKI
jgi:predicted CopG family antitoxin